MIVVASRSSSGSISSPQQRANSRAIVSTSLPSTHRPMTPSGKSALCSSAKWQASADLPMPAVPASPMMLHTLGPSRFTISPSSCVNSSSRPVKVETSNCGNTKGIRDGAATLNCRHSRSISARNLGNSSNASSRATTSCTASCTSSSFWSRFTSATIRVWSASVWNTAVKRANSRRGSISILRNSEPISDQSSRFSASLSRMDESRCSKDFRKACLMNS